MLTWVLFDPTRLFTRIGRLLAPVRYLVFLMWPAVALSLLTVVHNWQALVADTTRLFSSFNIVAHILLGLLTRLFVSVDRIASDRVGRVVRTCR